MSAFQTRTFLRLGLFSLLISGCTVSETCNFKNASGETVRIVLVENDRHMDLGLLKAGESVQINQWIWHRVEIVQGDLVRLYKASAPPYECVRSGGWWLKPKREFSAELRSDAKVYLSCTSPTTEFPISPIQVGHNNSLQADVPVGPRPELKRWASRNE